MPASLRLLKHFLVTGTITNKSNLRIGGPEPGLEIGGLDNPVIRDSVTRVPYVPGSSLKGKLRSLLEYKYGKVQPNGDPCGCALLECPVCTLFGPHMRSNPNLGPSRLLVRDAFMTKESMDRLEPLTSQGMQYAATKTENTIDRRTGRAKNPRTQEVVPPGCQFDLNISARVFEGDNPQQFAGWISEALESLKEEALGGGGSRGYGWVDLEYRFEGLDD